MRLVKRWFMETPEGDLLDGPFQTEQAMEQEFDRYVKTYKYVPVKVCRELDADQFIQPQAVADNGLPTGRRERSCA